MMKSGTSEGDQQWKVYRPLRVFAFLFVVLLLMVLFGMVLLHLLLHGYTAVRIYGALGPVREVVGTQEVVLISKGNYSPTARKLLTSNISKNDYGDGEPGDGSSSENHSGDDNNNGGDGSMNRIGAAPTCSKDSILVYQGATSPLPNGIPTYTVEIQNVCLSESCSISGIHLSCGWFSSARLVNPRVFRRIGYDDCLVNDGEPVNAGEVVSFQYANTFKYPLSVSSVSC